MKRELDLWHITNECVNCIYMYLLLATLVGMRSKAAGVHSLFGVVSGYVLARAAPKTIPSYSLSVDENQSTRVQTQTKMRPRNYYQQPYLNCFFIYNVCICNAHCLLHFGNISIFCGPPLLHHDDDDDEVSDLGENATL